MFTWNVYFLVVTIQVKIDSIFRVKILQGIVATHYREVEIFDQLTLPFSCESANEKNLKIDSKKS